MPITSAKWRISGIATYGGDELELSQLRLWGASAFVDASATITSNFSPVSGALANLLVDDTTTCVFSGADVRAPGFYIDVELPGPVEAWCFKCAGPALERYIETYTLVPLDDASRRGALLGSVVFPGAFGLSASPLYPPKFNASTDGWTVVNGVLNNNCSVSVDGQTIFGSPWGGYLNRSTDAGITWTALTAAGSRSWTGSAMSSNGQILLASVSNGNIYRSTDAGASWSALSAAAVRNWRGCAMSSDGQILMAPVYGGRVYKSIDAGASWTEMSAAGTRNWNGCGMSSDGQVLMAAVDMGNIYLSLNSGVSWSALTAAGTRGLNGCGVSSDGQIMVAAVWNGYIYMSTNAGGSWSPIMAAGLRNWGGAFVSDDGQILVGASDSNGASLIALRDSAYANPSPRLKTSPLLQRVHSSDSAPFSMGRARLRMSRDAEFGGTGRVWGTTKIKGISANLPAKARVVLMHQRSKLVVRETWSDPATGYFSFDGIDTAQQFITYAEEAADTFRPVAANRLAPKVS